MKNITFKKNENYAIVTIHRPEKLNALNTDTVSELHQTMQQIADDKSIRCIILTGAGEKAFVAGADISQITDLDADSGQQFSANGQSVFRYIEKMPIPVIAAVNGFALGGGCELAMACHIRIASSKAKFGLPEITLGIIPGYGGTQRLPRLIGLSNALQLMLTGDMIGAEKAQQLGLVSEVVDHDQLMERAEKLAAKLARQAPIAVKTILNAVYQGMDMELEAAINLEATCFGEVCETDDMKEGTTAFIEKRKANFKGK